MWSFAPVMTFARIIDESLAGYLPLARQDGTSMFNGLLTS